MNELFAISILDRYIAGILIRTTLLVLLILGGLFAFFSLIDQLGSIGRGNFSVYNAFEYVLLTLPRTLSELFPIAGMVGAMTTMGLLSRNSELTVIRAAGVTQLRVLASILKGGVVLAIIAILIAEFLAPTAEQAAQTRRSLALSDEISLQSQYGFWVRDGGSYVNVRQVLPNNEFRNVYIYEFDRDQKLRTSTYANYARYRDNLWQLQDIEQTVFEADMVRKIDMDSAYWQTPLKPDVINLVVVEPNYLGWIELFRYIRYLQANNQNTLLYRQALWGKIMYPFSILILLALAVPLVRVSARPTAIGQTVFMGTLLGLVFHIINQTTAHLGVVFSMSPFVSMALPSLLFFVLTLWLIRKRA